MRTSSKMKSPVRLKTLDSDIDILYSDRYIPSRSGSSIEMGYTIGVNGSSGIHSNGGENTNSNSNGNSTSASSSSTTSGSTDHSSTSEGSKEGAHTYSMLLRTELLGMDSTLGRSTPRSGSNSNGAGSKSGGGGTGRLE